MTECTVELQQVSKVFPAGRGSEAEVYAVREMNLDIAPGEFFTLLGPSGCGKTTTLRLIAGFETPTTGEIYLQGKPVSKIPPNRRPVNTVFQNYALFPHLNVADNVAFGLAIKRVPRAQRQRRVREALELVQLGEMGNRKPAQLSGGQQQRVALARALVNQPAVLLLDEPLGALDLKLRKAMQIELKQLQQQVGITFIYVTHDQEEALTMSDRIAVMNDGLILQLGDPVTLYERPVSRFVADFIGESNFIEGQVEAVQDEYAQLQVDGERVLAAAGQETPPAGQAVTLTIRPEKCLLAPAGQFQGEAVSASVQEVVYIGTDTRYILKRETGQALVVRVQNGCDRDLRAFDKGERVKVFWDPRDAHILKS
jgi:spermidine/putrescine transport system ATP-binding protein